MAGHARSFMPCLWQSWRVSTKTVWAAKLRTAPAGPCVVRLPSPAPGAGPQDVSVSVGLLRDWILLVHAS